MKERILILKTGELPRRVTEKHGPYEQSFFALLGKAARLAVVDAREGSLPDLDWRGIIVTGSASSALDEDPWIRKSEDFLRRAADKAVPIYGICFGHQILAQAFGGCVEKCPRGWELGTFPVWITPEARSDPLFRGLPDEFDAQQSHGDVVSQVPPGAVCLAGNSHWPIQAFRLGDAIWGTQFHPEFTPAIMEGIVHALTAALPEEVFCSRPADRPLKEWILSGLRQAVQSRNCLQNFIGHVNGER